MSGSSDEPSTHPHCSCPIFPYVHSPTPECGLSFLTRAPKYSAPSRKPFIRDPIALSPGTFLLPLFGCGLGLYRLNHSQDLWSPIIWLPSRAQLRAPDPLQLWLEDWIDGERQWKWQMKNGLEIWKKRDTGNAEKTLRVPGWHVIWHGFFLASKLWTFKQWEEEVCFKKQSRERRWCQMNGTKRNGIIHK
jgi:hypothetical protein